MSTEEDPELRDLIVKCLESNGVLGKIRAQLRANTFLALDQQDDPKVKFPTGNSTLLSYASSEDGKVVLSLIREFLSFFNMQYTISVFEPESSGGLVYQSMQRSELSSLLGLKNLSTEEPVLQTLLRSLKTQMSEQASASQTEKERTKNPLQKILSAAEPNVNSGASKIVENEYDEDFQSSSSISEHKNHEIKEASVDEELDISASDLLASQSSYADQDTIDKTTSNSTITGADHVEIIK